MYRPLTLVAAVDFSADKASSHFDIISVNRGDMDITKYFAVKFVRFLLIAVGEAGRPKVEDD